MPFNSYVGLPGSGKSYTVVKHLVLPSLKQDRVIVTNLALKMDEILVDFPNADVRFFKTEDVVANPDSLLEIVSPGAVWIVDEAWRLFPAGVTAKDAPAAFKQLIAEHRHRVDSKNRATFIALITQDLSQLASWSYKLCDLTYRTVKLSHIGQKGRYRVDVYVGAVTGPSPPASRRLRQIAGKYEVEIGRFYQSHTQSEGAEGAVDEGSPDDRGSLFSGMLWKVGIPVVLAFFAFTVYSTWQWFTPEKVDRPDQVEEGGVAGELVSVAGPPTRIGPASAWRIVGSIEYPDAPQASVVWLSDGRWRVRLPLERNCRRFAEGWLECDYKGQIASNELESVPVEVKLTPASVLPPGLQGDSTAPGAS